MEHVERIEKGWGHELVIVNHNGYCGKILNVDKGKQTSWHYHNLKSENLPSMAAAPLMNPLHLA